MDKTRFSNVCKTLGQLWVFYRDESKKHDEWDEFFTWADIGLPLAYAVDQGYVTSLKKEGKDVVVETWNVFCEMIAIDPNGDYDGVAAAFAASSNPPVTAA